MSESDNTTLDSRATIEVRLIRTDGGTQPRARLDEAIVTEYTQAVEDGAKFPPVVVFHDGEESWLADGFHRTEAHRRAGRDMIDAVWRQGTQRDALLYSVGAN